MGMICSWRERGKSLASQTVAFSRCTRDATSTGLPIPDFTTTWFKVVYSTPAVRSSGTYLFLQAKSICVLMTSHKRHKKWPTLLL